MNRSLKLLINPFERVAGYTSLLIGLLIAIASMYLAFFFNTRFDGVLDIHFVRHVTLSYAMLDQIANVVSLVLIFCITASIVKWNGFRYIDLMGTILFSRLPFMFAPLLNINSFFIKVQYLMKNGKGLDVLNTLDTLIFIAFTIVVLLLLVWYITLLYKAYTVSTNVKGWKGTVSFIIAIVSAEVLSKYLIKITLDNL